MKKLMFLLCVTICVSSVNYGMNETKSIIINNNTNINEAKEFSELSDKNNQKNTESFKASRPIRACIFLGSNIALGAWYYEAYVTSELKKKDGKLKKNEATFEPYSFSGHFIGGLFGGSLGTGIVMGLRQYQMYIAKKKLIEAKMALKKAQLDYKYSKQ